MYIHIVKPSPKNKETKKKLFALKKFNGNNFK